MLSLEFYMFHVLPCYFPLSFLCTINDLNVLQLSSCFFLFYPLIFLWAHLPSTRHQGKQHEIFVVVLLMLSGVREAICVLQVLLLPVHLSTMFVFSQQADVVDFMFGLNRLFPPYPFMKSCYLTCFSSSCIYVNDYSFPCFTCTY